MQNRSKRVVNTRMAATSTVRLIEAMMPKKPDEPAIIIVKPKPIKKRIPGTKLLIKLAKEREKIKEEPRKHKPKIDMEQVEQAIDAIVEDLVD